MCCGEQERPREIDAVDGRFHFGLSSSNQPNRLSVAEIAEFAEISAAKRAMDIREPMESRYIREREVIYGNAHLYIRESPHVYGNSS